MSPGKYLAAFDLDRTILTLNSSKLVVAAAREHGYMSVKQLLQALIYSVAYKFDLAEPTKIVTAMMGWLEGESEEEVIQMTKSFIVPDLLNAIRPEVEKEIVQHKENEARVILLSSALPYLCEPVAKQLHMDDIICTHLEVKSGTFTGKPLGKLVYKQEKKEQIIAYCRKHNFQLKETWYYGDAFTDRFILKKVGHPVCVDPEIKLRLLAKKNGWEII